MSDYTRQYTTRINNNGGWENYTSTATPLSASNLNKMDQAIQNIDEAAYTAINTKANQTTVNGCINNVSFDKNTGIFTITFVNGSTITINTALEKVVTNFTYDSTTQSLVLTLEDGSTQRISLAEFVTQYEFEDTDTIVFSVTDGKVSAIIKNGSITGEKLNPNYLTQITNQVTSAKDYARQSQSYAVGNAVDDEGDPYREGQATDNAKYYSQKAHEAASEAGAEPFIGATSSTGGTAGLVPAPMIADREKFLKGDGSWDEAGIPTFVGTQSEWNALSLSEKAKYEIVQITDDNTFSNIPQTDVANAQVGFTSSDTTDANATSWTSVVPVASGESLGGLFGKVSQMFKNVRYLFKVLGSTDISQIGDGTITGIIEALNSSFEGLIKTKTISNATSQSTFNCIPLDIPSGHFAVSISCQSNQYMIWIGNESGHWYAIVYKNIADGYTTPAYDSNVGTLTIKYI